jgi:amidase
VRQQIRARVGEFFRDFDVLLMPVNPVPAIPHDHSEPMPLRRIRVNGAERPYFDLFAWIALATMAYLPATVAPVGRTPSGLPVGVQIVGPYLADRTTIDFAAKIEALLGGFHRPPGF